MFGIKAEAEGRLGSDPEVKTIGQSELTKFNIAVEEAKKKGQEKGATTWVTINCWDEVGGDAQVFSKGDLVRIVGKISVREWQDKTGAPRFSLEIKAESIQAVFPGEKRERQYAI